MNSTRMLHGDWRFWMSQTIRLPCHIFIGSRTLANDQIPANHLHNTPCPQNVWHDLWSAFHHYQAWRNTLMTLITLETLWGMIWAYNIPLIRENLSRKVKNKLKLRDTQDQSRATLTTLVFHRVCQSLLKITVCEWSRLTWTELSGFQRWRWETHKDTETTTMAPQFIYGSSGWTAHRGEPITSWRWHVSPVPVGDDVIRWWCKWGPQCKR